IFDPIALAAALFTASLPASLPGAPARLAAAAAVDTAELAPPAARACPVSPAADGCIATRSVVAACIKLCASASAMHVFAVAPADAAAGTVTWPGITADSAVMNAVGTAINPWVQDDPGVDALALVCAPPTPERHSWRVRASSDRERMMSACRWK